MQGGRAKEGRAGAATATTTTPGAVFSFQEMNARLWDIPIRFFVQGKHPRDCNPLGFRRDEWQRCMDMMRPSLEERCCIVARYLFTWVNPIIRLAAKERFTEDKFPMPIRRHRAVIVGARLSEAFRDGAVLGRREAWREYIEPVRHAVAASLPVMGAAGDCSCTAAQVDDTEGRGEGVVMVEANPRSEVHFRGEPSVRGRLRWVGCLRVCDAPHRLYAGVEWITGIPAYRAALLASESCNAREVLHDGCVHGERLFHQQGGGGCGPRCSCEAVEDIQLEDAGVLMSRRPSPPSLLAALWGIFQPEVASVVRVTLLYIAFEAATPILLQRYVHYLQSAGAGALSEGWWHLAAFTVVKLLQLLVEGKGQARSARLGVAVMSALRTMIFEKCLSIDPGALAHPAMSAGRVLTMASADVQNFYDFVHLMNFFLSSPLLILYYIGFLFYLVRWNALACIVVLGLSFPVQALLIGWEARIQKELSLCTDKRLRRTNELFSGIRIVKMMGWESRFLEGIEFVARAEELRCRRRLHLCMALYIFAVDMAPSMMICALLVCYTLNGHTLSPAIVFPIISVMNGIAWPIISLPLLSSAAARLCVSARRLGLFFECDDYRVTVRDIREIFNSNEEGGGDACAVIFRYASVCIQVAKRLPRCVPRCRSFFNGNPITRWIARLRVWSGRGKVRFPVELEWEAAEGEGEDEDKDEDQDQHALERRELLSDVSLCIPRGKLTVVVGGTGCGKSTLLGAIAGAFTVESASGADGGLWAPPGGLVYVSQQPWIMQGTVRANITFAEEEGSADADRRLESGSSRAAVPMVPSPLLWRRRGGARVHVRPRPAAAAREERLREVVRCCQLEADLRGMPHGLETEIGEKGINLSGGQKARVSLARAVYADRPVYLLDDPLSALDAHVGQRILQDVVVGMLRGKTRVLVTHQLHALTYADMVIMMQHGRIVFSGSYADYTQFVHRTQLEEAFISKEQTAGAEVRGGGSVNDFDFSASPLGPGKEERLDGADVDIDADTNLGLSSRLPRQGGGARHLFTPSSPSSSSSSSENEGETVLGLSADGRGDGAAPNHGGPAAGGGGKALMVEEEKESGHVPWSVYCWCFRAAGGYALTVGVVGLTLLGEVLKCATSVWLSLWSVQYYPHLTCSQWLGIYLGLAFCAHTIEPLSAYATYTFTRNAACYLHRSMLYSLGSAVVSFFDSTPLGRVLNRFSSDTCAVDVELVEYTFLCIQFSCNILCSMFVTVYSTPATVVVLVLVIVAFYFILKYYTLVTREVRRRSNIAQSPMFSLLEGVMSGRSMIDVYGKARAVFADATQRLDMIYSSVYIGKIIVCWITLRLNFVGCMAMLVVALLGIMEKYRYADGVIPESRLALISLSFTLCIEFYWILSVFLWFIAVLESCMSSTQRILHYVDHVEHEVLQLHPALPEVGVETAAAAAAVVVEGVRPSPLLSTACEDSGGDSDGALRYVGVGARYREGEPLVLRDLNFIVRRGEKIGIVGRTGSGKSTLLQTLMRLIEVQEGTIYVNGRPARSYTLSALRHLFTMIPQDPLLFEGTVRSNIDPFAESTDAEATRALRLVGLDVSDDTAEPALDPAIADSCPPRQLMTLDTPVAEGGSSFSVGQRQLLCLARALLKRGSKFLLMDEATANVDPMLDRSVQRVVREQFQAYTVITIAHRLHTVAAYDRVLVMDCGRVVEEGSPRALIENQSSLFYRMVTRGAATSDLEGSEEKRVRQAKVLEAFLRECK